MRAASHDWPSAASVRIVAIGLLMVNRDRSRLRNQIQIGVVVILTQAAAWSERSKANLVSQRREREQRTTSNHHQENHRRDTNHVPTPLGWANQASRLFVSASNHQWWTRRGCIRK